MAKVSYVVTVYNKAPYLPFLLAGLESQAGDFEREFIFVDDGSTDGGRQQLGEIVRDRGSDWRLIAQPNQGPARALNRGLVEVTGDYVKPMDADDILLSDSTSRLLDLVTKSGQGLAFGNAAPYRVGGQSPDAILAAAPAVAVGPVTIIDDAFRRTVRRAQTTPSAWLALTETVRRAGGCDPDVFVQDYSIEVRIARLTGFVHLDVPVFLAPETAPGRMSERECQTLHDINLAICHLLRDQPELSDEDRRYAMCRILGRAWTWRRRHGGGCGPTWLSGELRRTLAARLGVFPDSRDLIEAACGVFRRSDPTLRLPAAESTP